MEMFYFKCESKQEDVRKVRVDVCKTRLSLRRF